jgi:hypothetical protein
LIESESGRERERVRVSEKNMLLILLTISFFSIIISILSVARLFFAFGTTLRADRGKQLKLVSLLSLLQFYLQLQRASLRENFFQG